jgi:ubiquitin carboxyl-terminal hydrolase 4/11/15
LLDTLLSNSGDTAFAPRSFKSTIGRFNASFSGYQQQDSQEFLAFLLDGLHEDLNRIHKKPATEKPELKDDSSGNTQAIIDLANESWRVHKLRNESVVLDLFGGLYKSTLVCPECNMTSITFDPFMDLTLPLPSGQIWSKDIYVFPRVGRPVILSVELSQSATGQQLKQYICDKLNLDIEAIHFAEIFNGMFYKNLGKIDSVTEISTSDNEIIACYELDFKIEDFDSDTDLIIPVYFEMESSESHFKAISIPFYIYLTTTEAEDLSIIQQKVLSKAAQFNDTSEAALKNIDLSKLPFTLSYHTVHNSDVPATEWRIFRRSLKPLVTPIAEVAEEQSSSNVSMVTPESNSNLSESEIALEVVKVTQDDIEISKDVEVPEEAEISDDIKLSDDISKEFATEPQDLQEDSANSLYDPLNNQFEDPITDLDELPDTFTPNVAVSDNTDINGHIDNNDLLEGAKSLKDPELLDDSSRPISPAVSDLSDEDKGFENLGTMFDGDDENTSGRVSLMGPPPAYSNYNQQRTGALLESHDVLICTWNPQAYVEVFGQEYVNATIEKVSDPELEKHRAERQQKKEQGIPLSDCLDQFSKTEVLGEDDLWHCSRCKDFRRASKTIELWKIPDIFTIHLKRFSSYHGMGDKLDDLVNFPIEGLDMTDRIQKTKYGGKVEETIKEGSQIYDLFGVDNHYGGLGGGHYTAFAKNFVDNEWYYFDDSRVRKANPEDSITSAAYLLFYRRRSADVLGGEDLKKILEYVEQNREVECTPDSTSSAEESTGALKPFQGPGRLLGTSANHNPVSVPWNPSTKLNIEPSGSEYEDEDLEDEDEDDEDDTKDEAYSPASESNFSNVSD